MIYEILTITCHGLLSFRHIKDLLKSKPIIAIFILFVTSSLQAADGTYKLETRYVDGRVKGGRYMIMNNNIRIIHYFQASTDTLTQMAF